MGIRLPFLAFDPFPLFQNPAAVSGIALAKNVRMSADQLLADLIKHIVDIESAAFTRDLGMHYHQEQKIAQLLAKMRVVPDPCGFGYFIRFFNCGGKERVVCLLAVPWTATRRAQPRDDLAKSRKLIN